MHPNDLQLCVGAITVSNLCNLHRLMQERTHLTTIKLLTKYEICYLAQAGFKKIVNERIGHIFCAQLKKKSLMAGFYQEDKINKGCHHKTGRSVDLGIHTN